MVSDWKAAKDAKGRTYYYNSKTGISQWEKPGEVSKKVDSSESALGSTAEQLKKNGWGVAKTKEGKVYYFNLATNESRWDMPVFKSEKASEVTDTIPTVPTVSNNDKRTVVEVEEEKPKQVIDVFGGDNDLYKNESKILHVVTKSKDEAERDFIEMLKENDVDATWSFRKIITDLGSSDPRYWLIDDDPLWKQRMFETYLTNRSEDQLIKEYTEVTKFKEAYLNMLKEHKEIKYYSTWKTVKKLIANEPIYKHSTVSESIKKKSFLDYIESLKQRKNEADAQLRDNAIKELREYLKNIITNNRNDDNYGITLPLTWEKLSETYLFENSKRYMANKHFKILTKYEVLHEYMLLISNIETAMEDKLKSLQEINYTQDRISRDNFKELLQKIKTTKGDILRADSKWEDVYPVISKDPCYLNMLGRNGSNVYELFLDIIYEKQNVIEAHRLVANQVLVDNNFQWTNDTFKEQEEHQIIKKYLVNDPRLKDTIDIKDIDLIIVALFKNWKEKEQERQEMEQRVLEQKKRYFKLMLERIHRQNPNISTSKYSELQSTLSATLEYKALENDDELREQLLLEYQNQIAKSISNVRTARRPDTVSKKRTLTDVVDLDY